MCWCYVVFGKQKKKKKTFAILKWCIYNNNNKFYLCSTFLDKVTKLFTGKKSTKRRLKQKQQLNNNTKQQKERDMRTMGNKTELKLDTWYEGVQKRVARLDIRKNLWLERCDSF